MRKSNCLLPALLPVLMASSSAFADNVLQRIEHTCAKYPTPEAQAACRQKQKAALDAGEAERKKASPPLDLHPGGGARKSDLCFTRQATGERICPN